MRVLIIVVIIMFPISVYSWDGVESETGDTIEIESGNLVREGEDIEVYDYSTGGYRDVEVESIQEYGGVVEVEVYDYETGETTTLEMDDN
jgi:hypothetical protein